MTIPNVAMNVQTQAKLAERTSNPKPQSMENAFGAIPSTPRPPFPKFKRKIEVFIPISDPLENKTTVTTVTTTVNQIILNVGKK